MEPQPPKTIPPEQHRRHHYFYGSTTTTNDNRQRSHHPVDVVDTAAAPPLHSTNPSQISLADTIYDDGSCSYLDGEGLISMNDNESTTSTILTNRNSIHHHRNERQPLLLRFVSNSNNHRPSIAQLATTNTRRRDPNDDDDDDCWGGALHRATMGRRWFGSHRSLLLSVFATFLSISTIISILLLRLPNDTTTGNHRWYSTTSTTTTSSMSRIPTLEHHITSSESRPMTTTNTRHDKRYSQPKDYMVPFQHIDRQTYNDPITNFMDPTLFHDSLIQTKSKAAMSEKSSSSSSSGPEQQQQQQPPPVLSEFIFPYPTGSFWTNLVLPATADQNLSYPIVVYPYAYKWSNTKVVVSYPSLHRIQSTKSIHDYFFPDLTFSVFRTKDTFDSISTIIAQTRDPTILQNIPTSIIDRKIIDFDPLSITLRYYFSTALEPVSSSSTTGTSRDTEEENQKDDNYWDIYLVQGSPYVTMKYTNALPYIQAFTTFTNIHCPSSISSSTSTDSEGNNDERNIGSSSNDRSHDGHRATRTKKDTNACSAFVPTNNNGENGRKDTKHDNSNAENSEGTTSAKSLYLTFQGTQFIIETQEGIRWMMFTSSMVVVTMDMNQRTLISISSVETPSKTYTGIVRYAIIPPATVTTTSNDTTTTASDTNTVDDLNGMNTNGIQRLIDHARIYPIAANVNWKFRSSSSSLLSESQPPVEEDIPSESNRDEVVHTVGSILTKIFHTLFGTNQSPVTETNNRVTSGRTRNRVSDRSGKPEESRIGTIEFQFVTKTFTSSTSSSSSKLLMLALPHHLEGLVLSQSSKTTDMPQILGLAMFDLTYKCIKGPMRAVIGSKWIMDIPLLSLGFDGDSGSNTEKLYLSPLVRTHILQNLQEDIKLSLPSSTGDIYGYGKEAARLAQLAHISHLYMLGDNSTLPDDKLVDDDIAKSVHEEATTVLRKTLVELITGKVSDRLAYDANFGGMVTINGLTDSHADFGNGRYNDHHFHYGYLLYACAIMGKIDPTFVEEYGDYVDAIFYDIANYDNFDANGKSSKGAFFPGARHKLWFDGHSYASGMFPFGNGKSQESSSEAVNGYYGAYLWSVVRHGAANDPSSDTSMQTDFARLLLATEIRGAKMYWHMMPPNATSTTPNPTPAYTSEFAMNYMVGNIGMLDALCSTWFGDEELYVHMINFIPVTSATGELFSSKYIEQEYTNTIKPLGEVEMAWRGYVVADHAIIEPNAAWSEAQRLESYKLDSALSKTQVLFWIATRSGFDPSALPVPTTPSATSRSGHSATCSSFPTCSNLGLVGDCCPTAQGSFLECCPH